MNIPQLLTPEEVAEILSVTTHTLAVWRCEGRYSLPYIKTGRLVRYRADDVMAFIEERTQQSAHPVYTDTGGRS
ncbi:MAG: helix-turn-helix domain-containing protein [Candidatus Thiodiazotropha endolucinida]